MSSKSRELQFHVLEEWETGDEMCSFFFFFAVVYFVTTYKWTCLIISLCLWYAWTLVSPAYYKWKRQKDEREWEAHLHKGYLTLVMFYVTFRSYCFRVFAVTSEEGENAWFWRLFCVGSDPDAIVERQRAMEEHRMRMQQMYDEKARVHAEKLKQVFFFFSCQFCPLFIISSPLSQNKADN